MASSRQRRKVKKVMHEYKHGQLKSGRSGRKVKGRRQAVAIAMSESGQSRKRRSRGRSAKSTRSTSTRRRSSSRGRRKSAR